MNVNYSNVIVVAYMINSDSYLGVICRFLKLIAPVNLLTANRQQRHYHCYCVAANANLWNIIFFALPKLEACINSRASDRVVTLEKVFYDFSL